MEIRCIFGLLKESYDGEYAPDLLAAIDEIGDDDNPDYLNDEEQKALQKLASGEYSIVRRITIAVDDKKFCQQFYGETLKGTVLK